MSGNTYVGQGALSPELDQRVQSELSGGERLVYVGQPRLWLYRWRSLGMSLFGCLFGGMALFMLYTVGTMGGLFAKLRAGDLDSCVNLAFFLPFLLVGGCMATAPIWTPLRLRRFVYALTDRRAVIFEPKWLGRSHTVRTYTPAALSRMYRVDRGNDAGHLVFEVYYTTSSSGAGSTRRTTTRAHERGFLAIDRVRDVEELVRLTLNL